jgi:hypothetical protein
VLGGSVSFQSVADYLIKRSKGPKPLFVRTRYGHYRLLRSSELSRLSLRFDQIWPEHLK